MEVYQLVESKEEVSVLVDVRSPKTVGRAAPGVRYVKNSKSRKGE